MTTQTDGRDGAGASDPLRFLVVVRFMAVISLFVLYPLIELSAAP